MSKKSPPPAVGRRVGYARVSTVEQNLDMQIEALKRNDVHPDDVHVEKVSGAADRRPKLRWLMHSLRAGDTLVVYKLDRLGRTMRGLLKITDELKEAGVRLVSISENIDFETDSGTLMFYMLAIGAEMERRNTLQRTRDGVKRALGTGKKFGQPPRLDANQQRQVADWINEEGLTTREAVKRSKKLFGKKKLSPTTVAAYARQHRGKK